MSSSAHVRQLSTRASRPPIWIILRVHHSALCVCESADHSRVESRCLLWNIVDLPFTMESSQPQPSRTIRGTIVVIVALTFFALDSLVGRSFVQFQKRYSSVVTDNSLFVKLSKNGTDSLTNGTSPRRLTLPEITRSHENYTCPEVILSYLTTLRQEIERFPELSTWPPRVVAWRPPLLKM